MTKQVGKRRLFENELYQKSDSQKNDDDKTSKNEDDKNLTRSLDKLVEQVKKIKTCFSRGKTRIQFHMRNSNELIM